MAAISSTLIRAVPHRSCPSPSSADLQSSSSVVSPSVIIVDVVETVDSLTRLALDLLAPCRVSASSVSVSVSVSVSSTPDERGPPAEPDPDPEPEPEESELFCRVKLVGPSKSSHQTTKSDWKNHTRGGKNLNHSLELSNLGRTLTFCLPSDLSVPPNCAEEAEAGIREDEDVSAAGTAADIIDGKEDVCVGTAGENWDRGVYSGAGRGSGANGTKA